MEIRFKTAHILDSFTEVTVNEIPGGGPPVDIYETEDFLIVDVDLPGIKPEEILIKVLDDLLILEGIRQGINQEGLRFICMERSRESFRKVIRLPIEIESERGKASYNNGVITIIFPKVKSRVVKLKLSTLTSLPGKE